MLDFDGTRKARRRDATIAAAILLAALLLVALPPDYQRPVRNIVRATVLRPFLSAQAQIAQGRGRMVDVPTLRAQRDSLAALVAAQASLSEENRQLRAALGLRARLGAAFVTASVLRVSLTSAESTFIVDVGTADGVYVGSPILTADGLLGMVLEVSEHTAQGIDWSSDKFRVSGMTADGTASGIVEPRRRDNREEDLLVLTGSPFQVDIRPGRRIVTSGLGRQFPRGVVIGSVLGIDEADTGWRKSYLIKPAVRPEAATHVLVGIGGSADMDLGEVWNLSVPPDSVARDSVRPASGGRN